VDYDFRDSDGMTGEILPVKPGKEERNWAMGCHLAAFGGYWLSFSFAQLIVPFVVWLIKRNDGDFINDQGKEAVNFQLSLLLYTLICFILFFVVIGMFLILPLLIFGLICPIVAAVKASDGQAFRYPMCIRFIK